MFKYEKNYLRIIMFLLSSLRVIENLKMPEILYFIIYICTFNLNIL